MDWATIRRSRNGDNSQQYDLRLDVHLILELEHLSVDEQKWLNELIEESVRDLLKKYREKRRDAR